MSAIRTEKHSNRKVLYINERGSQIHNSERRYIVFRNYVAYRYYYTLESAQTALSHLEPKKPGLWSVSKVSPLCLDKKNKPLPGWHRVIDPQNPHWSIVGSKYEEKWLDKGWRQLERKINQSPLQFFEKPKSELQGGAVQKTRRQRRKPPLFHFATGESRTQDAINYIADQRAIFQSDPDALQPGQYPIVPMGQNPFDRAADRPNPLIGSMPIELINHSYNTFEGCESPDGKPIERYLNVDGKFYHVLTTDKRSIQEVEEQIRTTHARSAHDGPEVSYERQMSWHLLYGSPETLAAWQASLKSSAPASNPSVLVLVRKVGTQIKMVYHSFWASRVRALNRHASENK